MLQVSIIIELIRSWPRALFWLATLGQATIWFLVPALFYASPPGDLPYALAIGHEYQLGTHLGPPLAYWLAEAMFVLFGGSLVGVYLLAQICVVVTYWAIFTLARAIVGVRHAAIALLLNVGIYAFGLPSPEFGPPIVAMPLTALALLHFWRGIGEERQKAWYAFAVDIGLLLLTSYAGLILVALMAGFLATSTRGRRALGTIEPWIAGVVVVVVLFPHLIWLDVGGNAVLASADVARAAPALASGLVNAGWLVMVLVAGHAGLALIVLLASGWRLAAPPPSPAIERPALDALAQRFIYLFALAPGAIATLVAALAGESAPAGGVAPHVVLSGLAVVVFAGERITMHRQRAVGILWALLALTPPALAVMAIVVLPWVVAVDLNVVQPAAAMGRFFAESFARRAGQPLTVVAGEARTAALVAMGAPSRPSLYLQADPRRSPWVSAAAVQKRGAVVVWIATDTAGAVPQAIKASFPDLVAEVPRSFERRIQGRLALLRVGWGVIRPENAPALPLRR
ncbi:MAG: glycosyltransferase family 39 protein [Proteobacteria bacterium]|nr:glycosyltransferase family 39 protein [Pseudomonadota bacterium]